MCPVVKHICQLWQQNRNFALNKEQKEYTYVVFGGSRQNILYIVRRLVLDRIWPKSLKILYYLHGISFLVMCYLRVID